MGGRRRAVGVVSGAAILALAMAVLPAASATAGTRAGRVGPNQWFTGVINGTNGNTSTPIPIQMACFGPVQPGQKGHPMKGQTLAVHQLFPPTTTSGSLGKTGNDSQIGVFFTTPPPATATAAARRAGGNSTFKRYDKTRKLSTTLTLPCSGTGTVYFSPIPVVPPSQGATVPVQYVSQP